MKCQVNFGVIPFAPINGKVYTIFLCDLQSLVFLHWECWHTTKKQAKKEHPSEHLNKFKTATIESQQSARDLKMEKKYRKKTKTHKIHKIITNSYFVTAHTVRNCMPDATSTHIYHHSLGIFLSFVGDVEFNYLASYTE